MVSVSVSKKIGVEKSIGIGFEKILVSEKVSVLVSKNFGIEKSIGIGFENFCSHKKYRYRFRKFLYWKKDTNIHDLFHHLEPWTIWAKKSVFN